MKLDRPNKDVTPEILKTLRGNTKFWCDLFPRLTTDAFVQQARHYLSNCSQDHRNVTYDAAVMNVVLPEALERIKELESVVDQLIVKSISPVSFCEDCNCGKAEGCRS